MINSDSRIATALENIYRDYDGRVARFFYFVNPLLFITGLYYGRPVLALSGLMLADIFFFAGYFYISERFTRNLFTLASATAIQITLVLISLGATESRFYFFLIAFLLTPYDSPLMIHLGCVIAYIFTILIHTLPLTNSPFTSWVMGNLVEAGMVGWDRLVVSLLSEGFTHIGCLYLIVINKGRTVASLEAYFLQQDQLARLEANRIFADEIAKGNFDYEYTAVEGDDLGVSLMNMQRNLKEAAAKEEIERFVNVGITEINEILRTQNHDINVLADALLAKIVQYLDAQQGALYVVHSQENMDLYMEMLACYAYNRRKSIGKRYEVGEGLVGQCYLEKQPIYLKEIPPSYQPINTGLGTIPPQSILIFPLISQDKVVGVLELASLEDFPIHERQFAERIAKDIATTIVSVKVNEETKRLYAQSKQSTEEMRAQEEEMRQNMEELEATQEEMRRSQRMLLESQTKSQAYFNGALSPIISFKADGIIEEMNRAARQVFGYEAGDTAQIFIRHLIPEITLEHLDEYLEVRSTVQARKSSGETFPLKIFITQALVGGQALYLLYARDLSREDERESMHLARIKALEEELQQFKAAHLN